MTTPIDAIKKMMESVRLEEQKQWSNATFPPLNIEITKDFTQDVNFARRESYALAYKAGHQAATERLLPIIERAIEMANYYANSNGIFADSEDCNISDSGHEYGGKKAREFLLSISETAKGDSSIDKGE